MFPAESRQWSRSAIAYGSFAVKTNPTPLNCPLSNAVITASKETQVDGIVGLCTASIGLVGRLGQFPIAFLPTPNDPLLAQYKFGGNRLAINGWASSLVHSEKRAQNPVFYEICLYCSSLY